MRNVFILCGLLLAVHGCVTIDAALVRALADDDASICFASDVRGGAGSIAAPTAGYGQASLALCRSKMPNAAISLKPDGTISIEHK